METRILPLAKQDVLFTPLNTTSHPFENPSLTVSGPTALYLKEAAVLLRGNSVVAFPTETVYGLGANALCSEAVSKIYLAKSRPADNPLILHVASLRTLRNLLGPYSLPSIYEPLIAKFWPGPLTILLPLDKTSTAISSLCTSGQSTFAVRMPQHPLALALLHTADVPLAAPSANTSTRPSPTTAQHVYHDLAGRIPLILDGGPCEVGLESTVADGLVSPPQILRPGGISVEQIRTITGWEHTVVHRPGVKSQDEVPRTPGMKYRHYSPTAKIFLFESTSSPPDRAFLEQEGLLDANIAICRTREWSQQLAQSLGSNVTEYSMGSTGHEIARRLFALLRELDDRDTKVILMEGITEGEEGLAVMNRLRKAATVIVD